ncbi:hypothetical protein HD806DRAFT_208173 [Xylariaceae sp. AK1471]|nr:hypothetical protein HD806DRAFT_208173 [Xylariaceae sp. AK1471]
MGSSNDESAASPNSGSLANTCSCDPRRVVIDPDGDLSLKVGETKCLLEDVSQGGGDSRRCDRASDHQHELPVIYVVCSKTLSRASPVWKTLLYGGFAESKPPCASNASDWVVELPDDNPKAMATVLNIIHSRYESVPRATDLINLEDFYQLAVLTDKYNLTAILRPWASSWLKALKDKHKAWRREGTKPVVSDLERLSWIAWEMGDRKLFETASIDLALHCSVDANGDLQNNTGKEIVTLFNSSLEPPELHDQMKAARLRGIESLLALYGSVIAKLLEKRSASLDGSESFCQVCEPAILGTIVRSLAWCGYWPLPAAIDVQKDITQLASDLKTIDLYRREHRYKVQVCVGLKDRDETISNILKSTQLQVTRSQRAHIAQQAGKSGL